jgi:cytochrome c oxidase subunit 1
VERTFGSGIFDPRIGGGPILFQHMFWFYSHPAVTWHAYEFRPIEDV